MLPKIKRIPHIFFIIFKIFVFLFKVKTFSMILPKVPNKIIIKQCPIPNADKIKIDLIKSFTAEAKTIPRIGAKYAKVHGPKPIPKNNPIKKAVKRFILLNLG